MLKLIASNSEATHHIKTCSTSCILFNTKDQCCPIFKSINYEDPNVVKCCLEYIDIKSTEEQYDNFSKNQLEDDKPASLDFVLDLTFDKKGTEIFNYPFEPEIDFSISMPDIYWYVEPNGLYGCWIKKHPNQRLAATPLSKELAEKGWVDTIYRSPIPLHDHAASPSLKTRMCWLVDADGWGQYTLIIANKIKYITYPKPPYYKK